MPATILVVDDLDRPRRALANELADAGFDVVEAASGNEAWQMFQAGPPDVVVTDLVMPRGDGLDLLSMIRERSDVPVIMFTARGSVQAAASAFKSGADEFVASDDVGIDDLVDLVTRASEGSLANERGNALEQRLVGNSDAMRRVRERVDGLAPLRTPVLVIGEPGSGRDAIARALHQLGSSSDGAFVKIDASSSRTVDQLGSAHAVYLDGIELLPDETQKTWVRWLRDGESHGLDRWPRVLASTSSLLPLNAKQPGPYPELRTLLMRFAIELPPLRAIPEDIGAIADAIVAQVSEKMGRKIRLSPSARDFVAGQRWAGNATQLERLLERAIAFTRTRQIRRDYLQELLRELNESIDGIRAHHRALEREQLMDMLRETGGNVSRTAERLGRSRSSIYRLIERYEIPIRRGD